MLSWSYRIVFSNLVLLTSISIEFCPICVQSSVFLIVFGQKISWFRFWHGLAKVCFASVKGNLLHTTVSAVKLAVNRVLKAIVCCDNALQKSPLSSLIGRVPVVQTPRQMSKRKLENIFSSTCSQQISSKNFERKSNCCIKFLKKSVVWCCL